MAALPTGRVVMTLFTDVARRLTARMLACALLAGGTFGAAPAATIPFSKMFVFGDSLSDSGNNAIFFDLVFAPLHPRTPTPIPDNAFIPILPYASGRYSN